MPASTLSPRSGVLLETSVPSADDENPAPSFMLSFGRLKLSRYFFLERF
jgi:hypothetical protein